MGPPAGRPLAAADATGSTTFPHDPIPKRLTGIRTLLGGRTYTVSFGCAGDGKVVSMTTPAGTTSYGYDADGRRTRGPCRRCGECKPSHGW
ncbi:MAG: hypothetical protein FJX72_06245 [Armatimonadetes bacterium]|nr:hypothetical protein [Armatimonadota bacterium]